MSSIIPCHNGIKLESNRKAIRKFIISELCNSQLHNCVMYGDYTICFVNIKIKDVEREIRKCPETNRNGNTSCKIHEGS